MTGVQTCALPIDALRAAFSLVPDYLRSDEGTVSLSEFSQPLGRRFRALKLWAVLRCYGREGLQAVIREHVRLAELFEAWVRAEPGWEVVAPRRFSLVCFRRGGSDELNQALLERVNRSGAAYLTPAILDGRWMVRVSIGAIPTEREHVRALWDAMRSAAG